MLTYSIFAVAIFALVALGACRIIARLVQAIAFDVASYASTPAPSASAALAHYTNRVCFRSVRVMLALADAINARAARAAVKG